MSASGLASTWSRKSIFCRTLLLFGHARFVQFDRSRLFAQLEVEEFHEYRECHGEIDISFFHMDMETFNKQQETYHQQECQGEHFHRGVFLNKIADAFGK